MGEYRDSQNIRCFTPDNTDDCLYIDATWHSDLAEIIDKAESYFKRDLSPADIKIQAEWIHTRCLGYDLYDPSDYTAYIVISLVDKD